MNEVFDERHERHPWNWLHKRLHNIEHKLDRLIMKASELEPRFNALVTKVTTIGTEIAALRAGLGDADIPAAAEAALTNLETLVQQDVDAGAPATPPPAP